MDISRLISDTRTTGVPVSISATGSAIEGSEEDASSNTYQVRIELMRFIELTESLPAELSSPGRHFTCRGSTAREAPHLEIPDEAHPARKARELIRCASNYWTVDLTEFL